MNLVLIGYRGTGKTSVARHLAERLGWTSLDTDVEIERVAGRSIAELFADEGQEAFRDCETAAVTAAAGGDRQVIAVGGGAVLRPQNRHILSAAGKLVWLTASPETIHRRLTADPATPGQRPDLTSSGGLTEIRTVLADRESVYRQCADLEVDTEGKDLAAVAEEILGRLGPMLVNPNV
ncbi:MAG: shikimate kinase [Planctomycetia bacterium]|nr:shikimate kinase [Planctomycetia bacterium]